MIVMRRERPSWAWSRFFSRCSAISLPTSAADSPASGIRCPPLGHDGVVLLPLERRTLLSTSDPGGGPRRHGDGRRRGTPRRRRSAGCRRCRAPRRPPSPRSRRASRPRGRASPGQEAHDEERGEQREQRADGHGEVDAVDERRLGARPAARRPRHRAGAGDPQRAGDRRLGRVLAPGGQAGGEVAHRADGTATPRGCPSRRRRARHPARGSRRSWPSRHRPGAGAPPT